MQGCLYISAPALHRWVRPICDPLRALWAFPIKGLDLCCQTERCMLTRAEMKALDPSVENTLAGTLGTLGLKSWKNQKRVSWVPSGPGSNMSQSDPFLTDLFLTRFWLFLVWRAGPTPILKKKLREFGLKSRRPINSESHSDNIVFT